MVAGWIADELDVTKESVLDLALAADPPAQTSPLLDLKDGEWAAFLKKLGRGRDHSEGDFVVDGHELASTEGLPVTLTGTLSRIGQVRRVREVRALRRFQRWDTSADFVLPDLGSDRRRRPAPCCRAVRGRHFLRFDEERLSQWEEQPEVRARADILQERRAQLSWVDRYDVPEPRYVALHTIAHLLIRRLAFASGFAAGAHLCAVGPPRSDGGNPDLHSSR